MSNKYYDVMSKVKVDKQFKEKLIFNLEQKNQMMNREKEGEKYKKEGGFMKIKRVIITVISILTIFVSSGWYMLLVMEQ